MPHTPPEIDGWGTEEFRLQQRRTRLSLERTRLSTERTARSCVRTAFALTVFGFTIAAALPALLAALGYAVSGPGVRRLGVALILLGLAALAAGAVSHIRFRREVNRRWAGLQQARLMPPEPRPGFSSVLILAAAIFALGAAAAAWILGHTV